MKEIIELKLVDFLALELKFPNDMELGRNCRELFNTNEVNKKMPNDGDLGKEIRKYLKELKINLTNKKKSLYL